jgi:hypothetical protein
MNKLLVWVVLLLTPFAGVRVLCVDAPAEVSTAGGEQLEGHSCQEICARIKGAPSGSNCVLSGAGESLVLVEGVAVLPAETRIAADSTRRRLEPALHDLYLTPLLARPSPPPRF